MDIRLFQGNDVSLGRRPAVGNSYSAVGCRSYKSIPAERVDTPLDIPSASRRGLQRHVDHAYWRQRDPSFQQG
jgi:hypothetical protein